MAEHCSGAGRGETYRMGSLDTTALVFSEDSQYLAAAAQDGIAWVGNLAAGSVPLQLKPAAAVNSIVVSVQRGVGITSCEGGTVSLWNLADGTLRRILRHATEEEMKKAILDKGIGLRLIPGRNYFASFTSNPAWVRIFDLGSETELCRFRRSLLAEFAFSPNGRLLFLSDGLGTVEAVLWHPDDLIDEASRILTRNLTRDEWARNLPGEAYRKTCPSLPEPPPP